MGRLVESTPEGWRVLLDSGLEVKARVGHTIGLYKFVTSERVCVSLDPRREPVFTGYLD